MAFTQKWNLGRHALQKHSPEGCARHKHEEQRVCHGLQSAGYQFCAATGDYMPLPNGFTREMRFDLECVSGRGAGRIARVDFVVTPPDGGCVVFLEVDEGQHRHGHAGGLRRMARVMETLARGAHTHVPVWWVRFNPGPFKHGGSEAGGGQPREARLQRLVELLSALPAQSSTGGTLAGLVYMYYDSAADGSLLLLQEGGGSMCEDWRVLVHSVP